MRAEPPIGQRAGELSRRARLRFERDEGSGLFLADWVRALVIHYEVEPRALQPSVPFPLDLREGRAWVSLVAFTMERMRPAFGGRGGEWLLRPLSPCVFLNVRTYVACDGDPGIYFLAEWISSRLSVPLGPLTFGLPYRPGRLDYRHECDQGEISGTIAAAGSPCELTYRATLAADIAPGPCAPRSLAEFLLERYTAFTCWRRIPRRFRIWHEPWPHTPASVTVEDAGLLQLTGAWCGGARLAGAHFSSGARDVRIGWPRRVRSFS